MAKRIKIKPRLSDEATNQLAGQLLSDTDYNTLITYDADVYCEETGQCLAKFRKKIIPSNIAKSAYYNLRSAATHTNNRGNFSGDVLKSKSETTRIKKDGTLSNTGKASQKTESGIVGYFDRNVRFPYCRQTAFNEHNFEKFKKAYPIIKYVDVKYSELMPKKYALQRKIADETSQDFVIKDTSFTTVTVNKNWQTAVHTDKGDYQKGFGNLVVLRKGKYAGGYFVIPKYGVAFDLQNCDLLLVDVHQWHGNTPIKKIDDDCERISLVMYYREKMINCGTVDEELKRVKRRQTGDKIN